MAELKLHKLLIAIAIMFLAAEVLHSFTFQRNVGLGSMVCIPNPIDFGAVPLGSQALVTVTCTNTGKVPIRVRRIVVR